MKVSKQNLIVTGGLLFSVLAVFLMRFIWLEANKDKIILKINNSILYLEVASSLDQQLTGLSNKKSIAKNEGMLFVFEKVAYPNLWMRNMQFPLDIIWMDQDMKITDIKSNLPPCQQSQCPIYYSYKPAAFVLEVNSGWAKNHNIKVGSKANLIK